MQTWALKLKSVRLGKGWVDDVNLNDLDSSCASKPLPAERDVTYEIGITLIFLDHKPFFSCQVIFLRSGSTHTRPSILCPSTFEPQNQLWSIVVCVLYCTWTTPNRPWSKWSGSHVFLSCSLCAGSVTDRTLFVNKGTSWRGNCALFFVPITLK